MTAVDSENIEAVDNNIGLFRIKAYGEYMAAFRVQSHIQYPYVERIILLRAQAVF